MSFNDASIAAEKVKLHQANEARSFKANGQKRQQPMQKASKLITTLMKRK